MQSSFVAAVISVVSCLNFRFYVHTCHANLTNQCLLNVAFTMTKALNDRSSLKQNFHSLPPSNAISKTELLLLLVFLFFTLPFYFKLYKISTGSTLTGILWLCGLLKCRRFQISGNKSCETPCSLP